MAEGIMAKEKKIKKVKAKKKVADKVYDFSKAHEFFRSGFGRDGEEINVHVLNVSVGALLEDFKVFEDLNNVQSWPISTLIQRELDHKRASLISKDYLLKEGNTKYFPPLIAVLIPTDNEYKPLDNFNAVDRNELKSVQAKFIKGEEYYAQHDKLEGLAGGISLIPFDDEQGNIVWDKNSVSAVIIDGQHRYKALQEAREVDKSFADCKATVTLVDLTEVCSKTSLSPTDVARDLFVTINNTPVEVDETRLVLMDDKDVLSTFTQVLIDDSEEEIKPAIPPVLIDWDCEGAKHSASNSLSGVLVLRQIILSAMFDDSKVSTVEDRTNVRNVKKWKSKLEDWISPDETIESEISLEETIGHRFKVAEEDLGDEFDDEEEESMFLFSYSTSVSRLIKSLFKELYLSSFRSVFSSLAPYERLVLIAVKHGVTQEDKPLNNYYRSFKGKRALLKKDADLKKCVSLYEKEFSLVTDKSIPHTVMGQKSVFKSLFDGFLSQVEDRAEESYIERTEEFLEGFNDMFNILCPSGNSDENFFLTDYKMKKNKTSEARSIGGEFWKGIIIKYNGEIDYSKSAVGILSQIFQDIIFHFYEDEEAEEAEDFRFSDFTKLISRHERLIKKLEFEQNKTDEEIRELAEKVVRAKQKELGRLLSA